MQPTAAQLLAIHRHAHGAYGWKLLGSEAIDIWRALHKPLMPVMVPHRINTMDYRQIIKSCRELGL